MNEFGADTLLAMAIGIGLSAACGFRVFVPLLAINLAALNGYLQLAPGFEWIGSPSATIAFGMATLLEILAYYLPWLDHLLDLIASPVAIVAGTIATASLVTELRPFLKWTLAIIAGGGAAAMIQGTTVALRTQSSVLTGGMGNPLVSTVEAMGAIVTSLLAILVPVLCLLLLVTMSIWVFLKAGRFFFGRIKSKPR